MKSVSIYTDGACSVHKDNIGGWSFVAVELILSKDMKSKQKILFKKSGHSFGVTNNVMELTAIINSILFSIRTGLKHIVIYSDSAYCVNAINNKWLNNWVKNGWKTSKGGIVKNKELFRKLYKILRSGKINVEFVKVKGHSGDKYNELADKMATNQVEAGRQRLNDRREEIQDEQKCIKCAKEGYGFCGECNL